MSPKRRNRKNNGKRIVIPKARPTEEEYEELDDLIKLLSAHSLFLKNAMDGYENDREQVKVIVKGICKDSGLTGDEIVKLMNGDLTIFEKDAVKIWTEFLYKYDIDIKDELRQNYIADVIYQKNRYKFNIKEMNTAMMVFTENTCINMNILHDDHANTEVPGATCQNCCIAAKRGHYDCLRYLHKRGFPFGHTLLLQGHSGNSLVETYHAAISGDNVKCLEYIHKNDSLVPIKFYDIIRSDLLKTSSLCEKAAECNSVKCLKYLVENGFKYRDHTFSIAAKHSALECLKYLHQLNTTNCMWSNDACISAAREGNLECLKYLHENGCPWNARTCSSATYHGHINLLKITVYMLMESDELSPDVIHQMIAAANTSRPHFECLKYAVDNKCPGYDDKDEDEDYITLITLYEKLIIDDPIATIAGAKKIMKEQKASSS